MCQVIKIGPGVSGAFFLVRKAKVGALFNLVAEGGFPSEVNEIVLLPFKQVAGLHNAQAEMMIEGNGLPVKAGIEARLKSYGPYSAEQGERDNHAFREVLR
ncbi:MAG: hypothetical protein UV37_C0001G0023 [Candidatus Collierbacteria bacterium GW2011_GWA1_42_60]|nr:MAG: hypothetical protein UV37_C0001G0023 [Candidatus Collierbacteria bacterium GW2011_GWA1_42_60]